jgi:small-conductance mechanosensitive channel
MQPIVNNLGEWVIQNGPLVVGIMLGTWIISKFMNTFITRIIRRAVPRGAFATELAEKKREDTLINIVQGFFHIFIWIAGILAILQVTGVPIAPLLAGAGIIGVAVGFGSQSLVKDVINGLFIIAENQFRIGDVVEIGGKKGVVEGMTLRVTRLRDMDGTIHCVPNSQINVSSNSSMDYSMVNIVIGVGYSSNLDDVRTVVNRLGGEMATDPDFGPKILEAPYFLRVDELNTSSVDIRILSKVLPKEQFAVAGELRKRLKEIFDKEHIDIPFPTRTLINVSK